LNEHSLLTAM